MTKKIKDMTPEQRKARIEYQRKWCKENREKCRVQSKAWRDRNPEYSKEYYALHKEERKAYMKERYKNDPEAYHRWYKEHREEKLKDPDFLPTEAQRSKQWREDHREENRAYMREYMYWYRRRKKDTDEF